MAKRYRKKYRRRYKKDDDLFEPMVGIITLGALGLYLNNYGFDVSTEGIVYLFMGITGILAAIIIGAYFTKKQLRKFKRNQFYKQQRQLSDLLNLHPKDFEEYLAATFEQMGYKAETTSYGKDHGIDVVIKKDGNKYAIQAKRYGKDKYIGGPAVRDFFGSYAHSDFKSGFFVTTSFFSEPAKQWAKDRNVELIDGAELTKMMNSTPS